MAYGIISMNNYNKMQDMQENIDYCMAFIEENTSFLLSTARTDTEQSQPVLAMQQNVQAENESAESSEAQTDETKVSEAQTDETKVSEAQTETYTAVVEEQSAQEASDMQALAQPVLQDTAQQPVEQNTAPIPDQTSTPQYYVVRKGDTLRTICYDIYGDYSRVDEICRWNNIDDPDNILYGQKLLLP